MQASQRVQVIDRWFTSCCINNILVDGSCNLDLENPYSILLSSNLYLVRFSSIFLDSHKLFEQSLDNNVINDLQCEFRERDQFISISHRVSLDFNKVTCFATNVPNFENILRRRYRPIETINVQCIQLDKTAINSLSNTFSARDFIRLMDWFLTESKCYILTSTVVSSTSSYLSSLFKELCTFIVGNPNKQSFCSHYGYCTIIRQKCDSATGNNGTSELEVVGNKKSSFSISEEIFDVPNILSEILNANTHPSEIRKLIIDSVRFGVNSPASIGSHKLLQLVECADANAELNSSFNSSGSCISNSSSSYITDKLSEIWNLADKIVSKAVYFNLAKDMFQSDRNALLECNKAWSKLNLLKDAWITMVESSDFSIFLSSTCDNPQTILLPEFMIKSFRRMLLCSHDDELDWVSDLTGESGPDLRISLFSRSSMTLLIINQLIPKMLSQVITPLNKLHRPLNEKQQTLLVHHETELRSRIRHLQAISSQFADNIQIISPFAKLACSIKACSSNCTSLDIVDIKGSQSNDTVAIRLMDCRHLHLTSSLVASDRFNQLSTSRKRKLDRLQEESTLLLRKISREDEAVIRKRKKPHNEISQDDDYYDAIRELSTPEFNFGGNHKLFSEISTCHLPNQNLVKALLSQANSTFLLHHDQYGQCEHMFDDSALVALAVIVEEVMRENLTDWFEYIIRKQST